MDYDSFRAMNTDILLAANGSNSTHTRKGFLDVRQLIAQNEQRFTRFSETSELVQLNCSSGGWFRASDEMFEVMGEAYRLAVETGGLFNPAILPALIQAGYDRDFDQIKDSPSRMISERRVDIPDFRLVRLDPGSKSILIPPGMKVDLGGIAKGWIAEQAARQLSRECGACAVNAGGDMFLINLPDGQKDWEVGLENPLLTEQDLVVLHVQPGAVATSSTVKRQWLQDGHVQHHLIDPRSGKPATTDWLSVTVWAEKAVDAEVYAKALLIGGQNEADKIINNPVRMAFLAVDKKLRITGSSNYHEVFHV